MSHDESMIAGAGPARQRPDGGKVEGVSRDRRRTVSKLSARLALALAPMLTMLFRLWMATIRIRWVHYAPTRELEKRGERLILASCHGRMIPFVWSQRFRGAATMVSEHRDGEILAKICECLGYRTVRGSSTRGGARAFLEILRKLRDAQDMVIIPDGPRGPLFNVQPGAILLAARTRAWIITASFVSDHQWEASSWDRLRVPLPFARMTVVMGEPYQVPRRLSPGEMDEACSFLSERMRWLDDEARRLHGVDRPDGLGPGPWPGCRSHRKRNAPRKRP